MVAVLNFSLSLPVCQVTTLIGPINDWLTSAYFRTASTLRLRFSFLYIYMLMAFVLLTI